MQQMAIAFCLVNFGLIGALPLCFFARGRFNLRWWLTACPLFLAGGMLVLAMAGTWPGAAWRVPGLAGARGLASMPALISAAGAMVLASLSIIVLACAVASHRRRPALWHQDEVVPQQLVIGRAYRYVRHPMYLAFVLAFLAALAAVPALPMLLVALAGIVALNLTARREERRLLASPHGAEYVHYMASTGRLLPRWTRT